MRKQLTMILIASATFLLVGCGGGGGSDDGIGAIGDGGSGGDGGGDGGSGGGSGGGGGGGSTPSSDFKPGFDFVFEGVDASDNLLKFNFFLDDQSQGLDVGNFDPTSTVEFFSSSNESIRSAELSGSFSKRKLEFVVPATGGPDSTTYSGVFVNDDIIELTLDTPDTAVLTIRRNEDEFFAELEGDGLENDTWKGFDSAMEEHIFRFNLRPGFSERLDATALFNGEEDFGGDTNTLTGHFSVAFITFIVDRSSGEEIFTGSFARLSNGEFDPDAIEFSDDFVIQRQ